MYLASPKTDSISLSIYNALSVNRFVISANYRTCVGDT